MEAVVLYRVPLILMSHCGVGFTAQVEVYDVRGGSVGKTLKLFLVYSEKDVVLDTLTIEVAGNQTLTAEGLHDGLVALLANFAIKSEMFHLFNLKMCYSVLFFKHPIAPKNLCGFFKRAKVIIIFVFTKKSEACGNAKEVFCLEGCASDKAAVDVLLREEFLCI